ncbi:uncharacterized protein LOC110713095 [Chenopodium quinoa]|uniref:uncharacterized protein LOC110713095 n=1 Tax=Chenopodium quinoa TaxID=63459 RepID=UPI000B77B255|nr:uncharacterized protein LOC110713095 [Chenopodium quinoa]
MLENHIVQLANPLKDCAIPSSLPSQEIDPKEPFCPINTRSSEVLEESVPRKSKEGEERSDSSKENKHEESSKMIEKSNEEPKVKEKKKDEVYKPKLPYLQNFNSYKLDEQIGQFIEMLKKIHLSIPFTEVLEQMPNYARFLKEILSGKRDYNMVEPVNLGECCSAFIHNDLPQKLKDPGSFSIPCIIKGKLFLNALCDLGASVSIMPYSVFKRLKIDIAEDDHIPIILGRPFLATSGSLIDVKGGQITLRVGNKEESFELKSMHESLSFVKGIMCVNSPRSIDNVSEEKKEFPKLIDEEEIDIPHWFELHPQEEDDDPKSVDGAKSSTKRNKAKKKARASRKKRKRMRLWKEKLAFEELSNEVSSSNNDKLLKIEEKFAPSATLKKVVFFDPP